MTDSKALNIIAKGKIDDIAEWSEAVYIAAKKLEECQWYDYIDGDCRLRFGMRVILGIRFDDGSRDSINGFVMYDMEKGFYLAIDSHYKNHYTENAVIEKWMKYPDYN